MSKKINFEKISESELKVTLSESTPLEMVDTLVKSLTEKGMTEDLSKSTLTTRYFYKNTVMDKADDLLKALEDMAKAKKLPWWASHEHEVNQHRSNNMRIDSEVRAKKLGIAAPKKPSPPATAAATPASPINAAKPNTLFHPDLSGTVNYKGIKKDEDGGEEVDKKAEADKKKKELADRIKNKSLNKGWGQHLPFPSAEDEIMKLAKTEQKSGEDVSAQQLAHLLAGKKMMGDIPVGMRQMFVDPPAQPNDQQMFGHLEVTEDMAKKAQDNWSGSINNFYAEASKPISQKFNSEEEELAYWNNIKVADRDDGKEPGY